MMETFPSEIHIVYVLVEQDVVGQVVTVLEDILLGLTDLVSLIFVQQEVTLLKMTVEDGGVILVVRLVLDAHKFSEQIMEFKDQQLGEEDQCIVPKICIKLHLTQEDH
jgi:hypothetical protein